MNAIRQLIFFISNALTKTLSSYIVLLLFFLLFSLLLHVVFYRLATIGGYSFIGGTLLNSDCYDHFRVIYFFV